jgi:hypothetical protein
MRKHRGMGLVLAALMLVAAEAAVSQGTTDTFVKGASDFLLDRANDNYIYIFQKKLESNPLLGKYLPATLRVVKAGDLRSLIMHKELWEDALKQDLVGDGDRLFTKVLDEWEGYTKRLCGAEGKSAEEACKEVQQQISNARSQSAMTTKPGNASAPSPASAEGERAVVMLRSPGTKDALSDLTRDISQIKPQVCKDLKIGKYTACMIEILSILEAVSHADYVVNCYFYGNMCSNANRDGLNANREEDDDFSNFRRYALFFAQLADAAETNDRSQVNALLKSVTIPPVSFGIKREPHSTRVLVTAYVGGGWSRQTASPHQQVWGIVAPVGVEISQARDSGNSLSLLLSPLDFGYPLTLKMKSTDATIKGSDVVVPAAYAFYGLKNYPLAIGVGYSRGRSIDNPDQRVGRVLILIAFDMPLFRLH